MAGNKYGAKKIKDPATGYVFDSKHEFNRWCELRLLERAGKITELRRQVKYVLIPAQREASTEVYKAGPNKGLPKPGAVIEKACTYVADFRYFDENGKLVVEDAKGHKTEAYKIKKKLMLWVHNIRIKET
ncbi:MAG: DUF1064 domain-containing protein [Bacteroidales bacterium]|nr:DUF1064 domain-containing protein [Bacteroidales bacterium]